MQTIETTAFHVGQLWRHVETGIVVRIVDISPFSADEGGSDGDDARVWVRTLDSVTGEPRRFAWAKSGFRPWRGALRWEPAQRPEPANTYPDGGPSTCAMESDLLAGGHSLDFAPFLTLPP